MTRDRARNLLDAVMPEQDVSEWQANALAHPLTDTHDVGALVGLVHDKVIPGGNLLRVILAIDR